MPRTLAVVTPTIIGSANTWTDVEVGGQTTVPTGSIWDVSLSLANNSSSSVTVGVAITDSSNNILAYVIPDGVSLPTMSVLDKAPIAVPAGRKLRVKASAASAVSVTGIAVVQ